MLFEAKLTTSRSTILSPLTFATSALVGIKRVSAKPGQICERCQTWDIQEARDSWQDRRSDAARLGGVSRYTRRGQRDRRRRQPQRRAPQPSKLGRVDDHNRSLAARLPWSW
jgi:hypothetical protein